MGKSEKTEEKKFKVYCQNAPRESPDHLSFPEYILKCENVLSTTKEVKVFGDTSNTDSKILAKWSEKIIIVVNTYLSPVAQERVMLQTRSIGTTMTWFVMRKALMICFGSESLNEKDEFGRLVKLLQTEHESPNSYYNRLVMTQQIYAIAVDFVHGDGLRDSAKVPLTTRQSTYPYYFIDEFNKSSVFKELYFQGMSKFIRDSWERIKGVGIESIVFVELQELVRWCNNTYVKKMNKKRTPDVSTKHGSVNVHFEDNSSDEEEDKTETYTKRTKDDKNPSTSITDKVLNALVQSSESVNKLCSTNVDCVNKMCASNSDSINRMCASNNSNMDKMFSMMEKHRDTVEGSSSSNSFPDGLFATSQRQTRSNPYDGINSMYNSTESLFLTESPADSIFALPHRQPQPPTRRMMTTTSSCWICGQTSHFAPKSLHISYRIIYYNLQSVI